MEVVATCRACGAALSVEGVSEGLCPACLTRLALGSGDRKRVSPGSTAATALTSDGGLGHLVRGGRYHMLAQLGHGGMGEVWLAVDLKLRVEVALKALKPGLLTEERALQALRQEVRAAREVVSPNVCRVYDLIELDGQELVSMEYIDGTTLAEMLEARAPLDLAGAHEIAAQLLAGLEAIHAAGLVHRDVKPENIMTTRSGRVVLMDFGIARSLAESSSGTVSGTRAYMAPEQARGEPPSARADVFSAGIVLAEMVAPGGVPSFEARRKVWQGVHRSPPDVAESKWAPVIRRAVALDPAERFASAAALARALEEVTLRSDRGDDVSPYPGLASFSAEQAEFYFGRELEIEEMWKKLAKSHLLGLMGPSGAGKSSFVRAGIVPAAPVGWRVVVASPGTRPLANLARELVPEMAGDTAGLQLLVRADDPSSLRKAVGRWRSRHDEVLVVLDQFEELFTLNSPEVQEQTCRLVGDLVMEADARVLVAMRDDFLFRCAGQPALAPLFSELTPLRPLAGAALRRALVQPALKCGYRFEDDSLLDELLAEVRDERGALPLVAFAASRLWEHRDRQQGLITRVAYEHVGGVTGALARHAEKALQETGADSLPIVRELFRNLVTAQGTRAARTRDELLSVFADGNSEGEPSAGSRAQAEEVLNALVNARLLTTYELKTGEPEALPEQLVEIVHESLLSNWPRLVRWLVQDREGALLRDQLRQAAQLWAERGQPDDLLWTGTSYREYSLWREHYGGGLSTIEESFAEAMRRHAERRRRTRRRIRAAVFAALLVGLGVVGAFWRQAVRAGARAEANQLLALGRLQLESDPTGALAYAIASLERADQPAARRFALETLWRGPVARVLVLNGPSRDPSNGWSVDFSRDGRWLAVGGNVRLWSRAGGDARVLSTVEVDVVAPVRFSAQSDLLVSRQYLAHTVQIWSIPEGRLERTLPFSEPLDFRLARSPQRLFVFSRHDDRTRLVAWPLGGGPSEPVAELSGGISGWSGSANPWTVDLDGSSSRIAYVPFVASSGERARAGEVDLLRLGDAPAPSPRVLGRHADVVDAVAFDPDGMRLASADGSGEVRIWALDGGPGPPLRVLHHPPGGVRGLTFDASGSRLAATSDSGHTALWDLDGPPDAGPVILRRGDGYQGREAAFDPSGEWLATVLNNGVQLWPVGHPFPFVLEGHTKQVTFVAFLPDGKRLVSVGVDGTLRLWPLSADAGSRSRVLLDNGSDGLNNLSAAPAGDRVLVSSDAGAVWLVPVDGAPPRKLGDSPQHLVGIALGSRYAAMRWGKSSKEDSTLRVWNLESGEVRDFEGAHGWGEMQIAHGDRLIWGDRDGVHVRDLVTGGVQQLSTRAPNDLALGGRGRLLLAGGQGERGEDVVYDLDEGTSVMLTSHGPSIGGVLDASGQVAVTRPRGGGPLRMGRIGSDRVDLLPVPKPLYWMALSPDARWLATWKTDGSPAIALWPLPDLSRPPLHTLPHDQLLAKLRTITNLRVVADPGSATGWGWRLDPFPGWDEVPSW